MTKVEMIELLATLVELTQQDKDELFYDHNENEVAEVLSNHIEATLGETA